MRLLPSSLGGRLIAGLGLFTMLALAVTLFVMAHLLERFVTGQIDQRLDNKIVALASQLRVASDGTIVLDGDADGPPFDEPRHLSFWHVAGPRNALQSRWLAPGAFVPPSAAAMAAAPKPPPPPGGRAGPHPATLRAPGPDGIEMHMRLVVREVAGSPITILAAAPRRAIADPMREAMTTLTFALVVLGAALLLAAVLLSRLVLRPLTRLRADVADVRAGRCATLAAAQPDEVRPLVDELNALLAQNDANLARARTHVANLAHGLKTPLATLSLSLSRLDGDAAAPLAALVAGIERRVRHHLARARAAALAGPVRVQTALRPRLVDVLDALAKIHAEKRVAVALDCPADTTLACEPQDVDEMLGNLLDNAFKYAARRVDCAVRAEGTRIVVEIADDGGGLDAAEIARVLRPGQRLDEAVSGFGFGLPIARELAELYGGSLHLVGRERGLLVRLDLPRAV